MDNDFDTGMSRTRPYKKRNKLERRDESVFYREDAGKPQFAPNKEEDPPQYARYQEDPGANRKYKRSNCQHDEIAAKKVKESKQLNE